MGRASKQRMTKKNDRCYPKESQNHGIWLSGKPADSRSRKDWLGVYVHLKWLFNDKTEAMSSRGRQNSSQFSHLKALRLKWV